MPPAKRRTARKARRRRQRHVSRRSAGRGEEDDRSEDHGTEAGEAEGRSEEGSGEASARRQPRRRLRPRSRRKARRRRRRLRRSVEGRAKKAAPAKKAIKRRRKATRRRPRPRRRPAKRRRKAAAKKALRRRRRQASHDEAGSGQASEAFASIEHRRRGPPGPLRRVRAPARTSRSDYRGSMRLNASAQRERRRGVPATLARRRGDERRTLAAGRRASGASGVDAHRRAPLAPVLEQRERPWSEACAAMSSTWSTTSGLEQQEPIRAVGLEALLREEVGVAGRDDPVDHELAGVAVVGVEAVALPRIVPEQRRRVAPGG